MMTNRFQCLSCGGVYFDVSADGSIYHHACPSMPPTKAGNVVERDNKRDENIVLGAHRRAIGILSEGAGVTCLTSPQLQEPAWITKLKARVEREEAKRNG